MVNDSAAEKTAEQEPFADVPCDCAGCMKRWSKRVEFLSPKGRLEVRFVCSEHNAVAS